MARDLAPAERPPLLLHVLWDEKWVPVFVAEGTAPRSIVVSQAYEDLLRSYDEL
jgi:hypothetical protein